MWPFLLAIFFLPVFLQNAIALELQPVRPYVANRQFGKRADVSALDLKSAETFLWGGATDSEATLANFTVYMPDDFENILSMERFEDMLKSVDCAPDLMTLAFKDDASFAHAQKVWDWVNGADNHSFIMVAGAGGCGWNDQRQLFNISALAYDEAANVARLTAKATDWISIAHSYDLQVGSIPITDSSIKSRDLSGSVSIGFTRSYPFNFKWERNGITLGLECTDKCGTTGQFKLALTITQKYWVPTGAKLKLNPQGVSATAELKLTGSGELRSKFERRDEIVSVPIVYAISIKDLVKIGPTLDVYWGTEVGDLTGSAVITGGATIGLKDSANLEVNLLNPLDNDFSGWVPTFRPIPFQVDAKISTTLKMYLMPALTLSAEALGRGYSIGLNLKMPYIEAKFEAIATSGGACDTKKQFGVLYNTTIGAELTLEVANVKDLGDPLFNVTLVGEEIPLEDGCTAFGPTVGGAPDPSASASPTNSAGPAPTSSGSATTCKTNAGLSGTCISTSACSSGGGKSEAGHCPGADNIQCCTYPSDSSDSTCTNKAGVKGTCMAVQVCKSDGGETEAGHCPGAANIQCCTRPPAASSNTCTNKAGVKGTCMAIQVCKSDGGQAEAGHCPGAANIQCCTRPPPASSNTCTNNAGVKGTCMAAQVCKSDGGITEAGHCSGAANIQCCTRPAPSTSNTCTTKAGIKGTCMAVGTCRSDGGVTEAGHCPGGTDIQCCTIPPKPNNSSCTNKKGVKGTCMAVGACRADGGVSEAGHCDGGADIQCCTL